MKTKFFDRTIKELQGQLEYERLRREKLECQLDESRVEVDQLKEMLEKTQVPSFVAVVGILLNTFMFLKRQYIRVAKSTSFGWSYLGLNSSYNHFLVWTSHLTFLCLRYKLEIIYNF